MREFKKGDLSILEFENARELPENKKLERTADVLSKNIKNFYTSRRFIEAAEEFLAGTYPGYQFELSIENADLVTDAYWTENNILRNVGVRIRKEGSSENYINEFYTDISNLIPINDDCTIGMSSITNKLVLPEGLFKVGKDICLIAGQDVIRLLPNYETTRLGAKTKVKTLFDMLLLALYAKHSIEGAINPDKKVREDYKEFTGTGLDELKLIGSYLLEIDLLKKKVKYREGDIVTNTINAMKLNSSKPLLSISLRGKKVLLELCKSYAIGKILAEDKNGYPVGTIIDENNYYELTGFTKVFAKGSTKIKIIKRGTILDTNIIKLIQGLPREDIKEIYSLGYTPKDYEINKDLFVGTDEDFKSLDLLGVHDNVETIYISEERWQGETPETLVSRIGYELTNQHVTYEDMLSICVMLYNQLVSGFESTYIQDVDLDSSKTIKFADSVIIDTIKEEARRRSYTNAASNSMTLEVMRSQKESSIIESVSKQLNTIRKFIVNSKYLNYIDTNCVAKMIASPQKVTLDAKNVSDKARIMTIKQFGVLSPYTTPPSNSIGLTRSLAKYVSIMNGTVKVPLYKVTNRVIDLKNVIYMDLEEQARVSLAFTGTYDYTVTSKGEYYISSDYVKATKYVENKLMVFTVRAEEVEYVTVESESILTFLERLMPFLNNDDGARILYTTSMLTQAVQLLNADIPRVCTNAYYKDIMPLSDYYMDASTSGTFRVKSRIKSDFLIDDTKISAQPKKLGRLQLSKRMKPVDGGFVEEGEMLYDTVQTKKGVLSFGKNTLIAFIPLEGYNVDDAFVISERCAFSMFPSLNIEKRSVIVERVINTSELPEKGMFYSSNEESIVLPPERNGGGFCVESKRVKNGFGKTEIEVHYASIDSTDNGDKIVGRHGNKGTCASIVPNEKIPCLKNNIPVDFVSNTIGIYPRMNIGTVQETKLGLVAWLLDVHFSTNSILGCTPDELDRLIKFCYDLTLTDNPMDVIREYPDFPDKLKEQAKKRHSFIKMFEGTMLPDGKMWVKRSFESGIVLNKPVTVGVHYMLKLHHIADHKQKSSGIMDSVKSQSLQYNLGQKEGEMELDCYEARGAFSLLKETMSLKSDCLELQKAVRTGNIQYEVREEPYSTKLLKGILSAANVELIEEDE